ncbi:MAG TPA: hypothetical protein VMS56_10200 [Thermoanaerobaculia bacterium]|nr:hypothetical protein [Thermoanaerobaculia bacterium]
MNVNKIEIETLPDGLRASVLECEVTGRRAVLARAGRPVAVVASWDEYVALRETIEIAASGEIVKALAAADAELARGEVRSLEQLGGPPGDRIVIAASAGRSWEALDEGQRREAIGRLEHVAAEPIAGAPLLEPLRGLWSLRAGGLRVVYRVTPEARAIGIVYLGTAEVLD